MGWPLSRLSMHGPALSLTLSLHYTCAHSVYGADKAVTNFPVAQYTARLAAAGIQGPAPPPGAGADTTAVLMAALASAVHGAPAGPEGSDIAGAPLVSAS